MKREGGLIGAVMAELLNGEREGDMVQTPAGWKLAKFAKAADRKMFPWIPRAGVGKEPPHD